MVGNVFAYRSTNVTSLQAVDDPVGPLNTTYLDGIIHEADLLIPCWGNTQKVPSSLRGEFIKVFDMLKSSGKPVACFGLTKNGSPKHPLMLKYDTPLVELI